MVESLLVCLCIYTIRKADRAEEFVAAGDFLAFKFPVWQWYVSYRTLDIVEANDKGERRFIKG
jgi:hypothetical protein